MKSFTKILWGLVLISLGVIIGLNSLGIANINIFFNGWWTLFIIVPSFIGLFKREGRVASLVCLVIGVLLLLACRNVLNFTIVWRLVPPIILVAVGFTILLKNIIKTDVSKKIKEIDEINDNSATEKETICVTFSGEKRSFSGKNFAGCTGEAVFGGLSLDLTNAKITEDVVIKTNAIFGGIDVIVPKDVNVEVSSTSIFGGVNNEIENPKSAKATVYINATCFFGGIKIK